MYAEDIFKKDICELLGIRIFVIRDEVRELYKSIDNYENAIVAVTYC